MYSVVELWLQKIGDFYEKGILHWNGGWKGGLKIFGPKYQKAHPNAKSGQIHCLAYVTVAVLILTLYGTEKEKCSRENPLETRVVYNTASLPRRCD